MLIGSSVNGTIGMTTGAINAPFLAGMPMHGSAAPLESRMGMTEVPSYEHYEVSSPPAMSHDGSITARQRPSKARGKMSLMSVLILSALGVTGCAKNFRHHVPEAIDAESDTITTYATDGTFWRGCAKATGGIHPFTKGYHPFLYGRRDATYQSIIKQARQCISYHQRYGDDGIFEYVATGNSTKPGKWKIRAACSRVNSQSRFSDERYVELFRARVKEYCEKMGGAFSMFTTSDLMEWNPQCVFPSGTKLVWGHYARLGGNND